MRKFISIITFIFCVSSLNAQTVYVTRGTQKIRNENAEGYYAVLAGHKEEVDQAWLKLLRDLGKTRQTPDPQIITEPAFGGTVYSSGILYGTSREEKDSTTVWLGLKTVEWTVNDIEIFYREVEKLVHQFGVQYYRDKIQAQIDEAQRALDAVQRQQQRLTNQNRDLSIRLTNNEQEKVSLEKSLEANEFENAVLIQRLENNKASQDSVATAAEQIKSVMQMHQERQRNVR